MKLTIAKKLLLTVLLVTALVVGLIVVLTRYSIGTGFSRYLTSAELLSLEPIARHLENAYGRHGSWEFATSNPAALWNEIEFGGSPPPDWGGSPPPFSPAAPPADSANPPAGSVNPPPADSVNPPPADSANPAPEATLGPPAAVSTLNPAGAPFPHPMHPRPTRQPPHIVDLLQRSAILDANGRIVWGNPRALLGQQHITLMQGGKPIGELRVTPEPYLTDQMEQDFVKEQERNLWLIAACAIAMASLAAMALSRDILGAVRSIVAGTRELASGNFLSRVSLRRGDELGQLAEDLNNLAARLEQQRNVQRQWMVDTSHELRTPIAILRAQIEALQDGVQPANPRTLAVLHGEVMALAKLVSDLHELARFDLGELKLNLVAVDVLGALQESVESFQERFREKKIEIDADCLDNGVYVINADTIKLKQLFANLLENSLRYTSEGGHLNISYSPTPEAVMLQFDDSEPGVPDELLPQLFDRFFRAEQSRSRSLGGSGLGLAICKAIVDDHGGTITAQKSPLGGVRVLVRLPARRSEAESGTGDRKQSGLLDKKQAGLLGAREAGVADRKQSGVVDKKQSGPVERKQSGVVEKKK